MKSNKFQNLDYVASLTSMVDESNPTKFLEKYVDNVLNNNDIQLSYDIWEECESIHTYYGYNIWCI